MSDDIPPQAPTPPPLETVVSQEQAGDRLDAFLAQAFPELSRSRHATLIRAGAVAADGRVVTAPNYRVKPAESIALLAPPPAEPQPRAEPIALSILYEDTALIVIDKPAGMVVHPAPGNASGTLVNALIHHCGASLSGIGGVKRPGIVHRLDKHTSGVMVVAKTENAHNGLSAQFADHGRTGALERVYTAFCWGAPRAARGTLDTLIGRDPHNRLKQAVLQRDGRAAITHYARAAQFGQEGWRIARLACRLETGRTHQIRVHCAHMGHPVLADPVYGTGFATKINTVPAAVRAAIAPLGRQALHAESLGFVHPETQNMMRFTAPLPADLGALATALHPYALD